MFKFIDLFSEIGSFRIAGENLGWKCVFSSEIDKNARETYFKNFGEYPFGDIRENKKHIPEFHILMAGFPCQPFSSAGLRQGFQDTRGTLFFEIEDIIKTHAPKAFILENVKGLLSHNKGQTFKTILESLKDYYLSYKVLNSFDYGTIQKRERIFIVGFKDNVNFEFPKPKENKATLAEFLEDSVHEKYTLSNKMYEGILRRAKKENGFKPSFVNKDSKSIRTITARYKATGGKEILLEQEGKNPRNLSPREVARLMSFPESYILHKIDSHAYKQLGNSIPVCLSEAVCKQVFKALS